MEYLNSQSHKAISDNFKILPSEMEQNKTKPVLVTGASGYIAGYIIKDLLEQGYKVRGTVRSLANTKKYEHITSLPQAKEHLQLVEGDLNDEKCWDMATSGCDYVYHVASPIPPHIPKNEDEVIIPAVNGTKYVLEAAIKNKVKKLVFTSSCLTLFFGNEEKLLNEDHWADPSKCAHYPKSKILAERVLWEIYNKQDLKGQHTQVVSVLPSLVLGPGMTVHGNSSEGQIAELMKGGLPGYPTPAVNYTVVDVRDTAIGHIKAMQASDVDGQRIALAGTNIDFKEVFGILKKEFPALPINDKELTIEEIKSNGNPVAQRLLMLAGKKFRVDNTKSKNLLKMEYIPVEKTIIDMGHQLIKLGVVPHS